MRGRWIGAVAAVALAGLLTLTGCAASTSISGRPREAATSVPSPVSPAPEDPGPGSVPHTDPATVSPVTTTPSSAPPTASATVTRAGGPTRRPTSAPGGIPGTWEQHGAELVISPSGAGTLAYRTYRFCSDDPTPPCDTVAGDEIVSGGHVRFTLKTITATHGAGTVTESDDPSIPVGTGVSATVNGNHLTLSIWPGSPFCAADTPPGEWDCGA